MNDYGISLINSRASDLRKCASIPEMALKTARASGYRFDFM